jgi:SanA protein
LQKLQNILILPRQANQKLLLLISPFMRKRKILLISFIILIALSLVTILYCDNQVKAAAQGKTFSDVSSMSHSHVGLLLGTGKYLGNGAVNPYYRYRIEAAAALLKAGKLDYLVISGDNSRKDYNEPETMRADLIAAGIDSSRMYLDYAGFRTFDSMVRLREIFSQDSVTIISQQFHNERALFIARKEGITAVGFNARDVSTSVGFRTQLREKLARVKVFVDYLFHNEPKFLGPKVNIPQ